MKELLSTALADGFAALVGTIKADGYPQISPKGSIAVFDEQTLSFWERSHRSAEAAIKQNAKVCVYYRNTARQDLPFRGGVIRFYGTARLVADGELREKIWNNTIKYEQDRDPEKKGVGVLIDVDRIEEITGDVIMAKD